MRRAHFPTCLVFAFSLSACPVLGDGGFFFVQGESPDLTQTRQEVVLAVHRDATDGTDQVTYVLRSRYEGDPSELAWVVPVPATPTDVTAHASDTLFEQLNELTKPTFMIVGRAPSRFGWGCGGLATPGQGTENSLVEVEASGEAGIYTWAALTSTGSEALVKELSLCNTAVCYERGQSQECC